MWEVLTGGSKVTTPSNCHLKGCKTLNPDQWIKERTPAPPYVKVRKHYQGSFIPRNFIGISGRKSFDFKSIIVEKNSSIFMNL